MVYVPLLIFFSPDMSSSDNLCVVCQHFTSQLLFAQRASYFYSVLFSK